MYTNVPYKNTNIVPKCFPLIIHMSDYQISANRVCKYVVRTHVHEYLFCCLEVKLYMFNYT